MATAISAAVQPSVVLNSHSHFTAARPHSAVKCGPVSSSFHLSSCPPISVSSPNLRSAARQLALRAAAEAAEAATEEIALEAAPSPQDPAATEIVKPEASSKKASKAAAAVVPKKQRIVLRFIWLEKNIGIALDQLIPGQGTVPISPYMFWPRKDAWEQLKELLDSKPFISRKRTIILLNQATDVINLWQTTTFKP